VRLVQLTEVVEIFWPGEETPFNAFDVNLDDRPPLQASLKYGGSAFSIEFRGGPVAGQVSFTRHPVARQPDLQPAVFKLGGPGCASLWVQAFREIVRNSEMPPTAHAQSPCMPQQLQCPLVFLRKRYGSACRNSPARSEHVSRSLEVGTLQRAFLPDAPEHPSARRHRGVVTRPPGIGLPARWWEVAHAAPAERQVRDRKDGGFVTPVLIRDPIAV